MSIIRAVQANVFLKALLVSLFLTATSLSAWADDTAWLVTSIEGDVRVRSLDASWRVLVAEQTLKAGTEIETTPGSRLVLTRGADTVIASPGSAFEIGANGDNANTADSPSITQKLGTLLFKIDSRAGIDRFRVRTPYLAAVIKGTVFSVSVTPEGSALHVTEGLVQVASPATGQVGLVGVGQTARVSAQGGSPLTIDNGRGQENSPAPKADDKKKSEAPSEKKNTDNQKSAAAAKKTDTGRANDRTASQSLNQRGKENSNRGLFQVASPTARQVGLGGVGATARVSAKGGSSFTTDTGRGKGNSAAPKADDKKNTNKPLKIKKSIDSDIGSITKATNGLITSAQDKGNQSKNTSGDRGNGGVGRNAIAGSVSVESVSLSPGASSAIGNAGGNGNGNAGGNGNGNAGGNGNGNAGGNGNGNAGGNGNGNAGGNGNGNAGGNGNGNAGGNGNGNGNNG